MGGERGAECGLPSLSSSVSRTSMSNTSEREMVVVGGTEGRPRED